MWHGEVWGAHELAMFRSQHGGILRNTAWIEFPDSSGNMKIAGLDTAVDICDRRYSKQYPEQEQGAAHTAHQKKWHGPSSYRTLLWLLSSETHLGAPSTTQSGIPLWVGRAREGDKSPYTYHTPPKTSRLRQSSISPHAATDASTPAETPPPPPPPRYSNPCTLVGTSCPLPLNNADRKAEPKAELERENKETHRLFSLSTCLFSFFDMHPSPRPSHNLSAY
ncbi:uncharacterized protein PV07_01985 [Cladophialophora immunda]|uniref:Uncharacterized protein n=1 Tax=Cladophialophora immunda TaxID=569365 RepID=A0A0D2A4M0_9EURO|nr:uncharacterized protein PV07_01985 [Cladophialophora immunda]KIW35281.1 hypothetical protein PV07_01985 [Cladophialophora immunda]OQV07320.1 hypothetical protein CLAIMM_11772 isoform 1 [Cladophialophora immunda]OQV07321.1 hypothetical protein CLAIMM_11772 isoform 2 [Cladophialophora immunda]